MKSHTPVSLPDAMSIRPASPSRYRWVALGGGIVALSTASILIRLAGDGVASPLAVGAWRMLLATALLTPLALPRWRRERERITPRERGLLLLSSLVLALHFATWITSLEYTTVASSVILVTTNPIYVGLASHFLLKQRLGRAKVVAIVVALTGSVLISYGDLGLSGQALLGDLLALLGALAHVSPLVVTLAILGEPVGATLLAALILHEVPPITALMGGILILAGIALASREEALEDKKG